MCSGWDDLSKDYNDIYHVLANCKPPRDYSTSLLRKKRILWLCKRLRNTLYTSFVPDLFKQHISANQNNMYIEHIHIHGVSNFLHHTSLKIPILQKQEWILHFYLSNSEWYQFLCDLSVSSSSNFSNKSCKWLFLSSICYPVTL